MKNIYNLIEEHKEIFDSIEESDIMIKEFNDLAIEWQTTWYIEDLLIEQMIYEDFNEEKIERAITESLEGKWYRIRTAIDDVMRKFVEWIGNVIVKMDEKINLTKKILEKYGKKNIEIAMSKCNTKVKFLEFNDCNLVWNTVTPIAYKTSIMEYDVFGKDTDNNIKKLNNDLFNVIGVKDISEIDKRIKSIFFKSDSPVEKKISEINSKLIMGWMDNYGMGAVLKKVKNGTLAWGRTLKLNKKFEGNDNASEVIKCISNIMNVYKKLMNSIIICNLKVTNDCRVIVLKALAANAGNKDN